MFGERLGLWLEGPRDPNHLNNACLAMEPGLLLGFGHESARLPRGQNMQQLWVRPQM